MTKNTYQRASTSIVVFIIIALVAVVLIGVFYQQQPIKETSWDNQKITYGDKTITATDLPSMIAGKGAVFDSGRSGKIKEVIFSPNNTKAAFVVTNGVHDFGWAYDFDLEKLIPLAFSYGGYVKMIKWQEESIIEFDLTTPRPSTFKKIIDLNNLPEYPQIAE